MRLPLALLLIACFTSCTQESIDLPNFDELAWQADKDGCAGTRLKMHDNLINVKSHLKGLNGDQVIEILGKPNKTNLADRNQKYFIYNIGCSSKEDEPTSLSIRFNAVGLSYEVLVY